MFFKPKVTHLFQSELVQGAVSETKTPVGTKKTFQASGFTSAGAGSAVVLIEASNDDQVPFVSLGTITLVLSTTPSANGFAADNAWKYIRATVTTLTGTNAEVSVNMGATNAS